MFVDREEAVEIFKTCFDDKLMSSYLHPHYVWADSQREEGLSPLVFVFRKDKNVLYYAFHLSQVPEQDFFDIQSPYGYGGPISNTQDMDFLRHAWDSFHHWCEKSSILAEFVRFHPLIANNRFFSGDICYDRNTVWIDTSKADPLSSYTTRARTAIRKAKKNGLVTEWWPREEFLPVFQKLYHDHMQALGADRYYFFPERYFQSLTDWEHARLAVCSFEKDIVGAAIFLDGPIQMEYHLSATTALGRTLCATNLMIHEAVLMAREAGHHMLHLGGGTDKDPNNPLLHFKLSFSSLMAKFCTGKRIHLPDQYQSLKKMWEKNNDRIANRVLFYR